MRTAELEPKMPIGSFDIGAELKNYIRTFCERFEAKDYVARL